MPEVTTARYVTAAKYKADQANVVDFGADPTGQRDSTAVLRRAFAGEYGNSNVYLPPGIYSHTGDLDIAPDMTIDGYGAILRLADNARKPSLTSKPDAQMGILTIRGITIDGNDANQGDETLGGDNYAPAPGMKLCSVGGRLNLIDVNVLRTRGHGINHWGWNYLYVRGYYVMQRKNPLAPNGGRRRDGITGASLHCDIQGVSGYTNDDLVALGSGIQWGPQGVGGAMDIETVNISNVSALVCDTDPDIKAWRAVALYTMNGGTFNSVVVNNVTGQTKSGHVMLKCYTDAYATGPESGSYKSVALSNISGACYSFSEYETFISLTGKLTVDNLVISNVARQALSRVYGNTAVPMFPTILVRNQAHVRTMVLGAISCVQEDAGAGRDMDLILIRDDFTTVDKIITNPGSLSLVQPYAPDNPGRLLKLRKSAKFTTPTVVVGMSRIEFTSENAAVIDSDIALGNGVNANSLTTTGIYYNTLAAENWPSTLVGNPQLMIVARDASGLVNQFVVRHRADLSRTYTRTRDSAGVWSDWLTVSNPDLDTWKAGVSTAPAAVSPATLKELISGPVNTPGQGGDANLFVTRGRYFAISGFTNWPNTSGYQQMVVDVQGAVIMQSVTRANTGSHTIVSTRYSTDSGATWSAWQQINAKAAGGWKSITDIVTAMLSPKELGEQTWQGGTWANRPKGNNLFLYQEYMCTSLAKPRAIRCVVKGAASDGSGDSWVDGAGDPVTGP